jgi:hypothetical protein
MAMMINDASLERDLIALREATGADRYDEVWEGMYMMSPLRIRSIKSLSLGLSISLKSSSVGPVSAWSCRA